MLVRRTLSQLSNRRKVSIKWKITRQTSAILLLAGTLMITAGVILYLIALYPTAFNPFPDFGEASQG